MFNWKGSLVGAANLLMATAEIISPENQKELDRISKSLSDLRDMVLVMVEDLKKNYLDDSAKPVWDGHTLNILEIPNSSGIPEWAHLKNLDDPDILYDVYKRYDTQKSMLMDCLNSARRLYLEESQKAESTRNEEAPSSSPTDTKDKG
jgi:hypothetical protein